MKHGSAVTWRILLLALAQASTGASAQVPDRRTTALQLRQWASACMACHGTDGRADGAGVTIAGRDKAELARILLEYKTDQRKATVMHQHAKGYTDDQLHDIAGYFAAVPR